MSEKKVCACEFIPYKHSHTPPRPTEGKPNFLGLALDQHIARLGQEIGERNREILAVRLLNAELIEAGLYAL